MQRIEHNVSTGQTTVIPLTVEYMDALRAALPPPTIAHVKAEAQRRIIVLVGTADLTACILKELNALMREGKLTHILRTRPWTPVEALEAAALVAMGEAIEAIRTKSNAIEALIPIPANYTADVRWA